MMVMQDSEIGAIMFNIPPPLQYPAVFYYWSYCLTMNIFLINIGLALIVDSLAVVKAVAGSSQGVPSEIFSLLGSWWVAMTKHDAELTGLDRKYQKEAEVAKIVKSMAQKALSTSQYDIQRTTTRGVLAATNSASGGGDGCFARVRGAVMRQRARGKSFRGRSMKTVLEETDSEAHERFFLQATVGEKDEKLDEGDITNVLRGAISDTLGADVDEYRASAWLAKQILEVCGEVEWTNKQGQEVERKGPLGEVSIMERVGHVRRASQDVARGGPMHGGIGGPMSLGGRRGESRARRVKQHAAVDEQPGEELQQQVEKLSGTVDQLRRSVQEQQVTQKMILDLLRTAERENQATRVAPRTSGTTGAAAGPAKSRAPSMDPASTLGVPQRRGPSLASRMIQEQDQHPLPPVPSASWRHAPVVPGGAPPWSTQEHPSPPLGGEGLALLAVDGTFPPVMTRLADDSSDAANGGQLLSM